MGIEQFAENILHKLSNSELRELCDVLHIKVPQPSVTKLDLGDVLKQDMVTNISRLVQHDRDTSLDSLCQHVFKTYYNNEALVAIESQKLPGLLRTGTFISWVDLNWQKIELNANTNYAGDNLNPSFFNAFIPVVSPRKIDTNAFFPEKNGLSEELDQEIDNALAVLDTRELDFKKAERELHSGIPSYEKIKTFLIKLATLRSKEDECRFLLIRKNKLLVENNSSLTQAEAHTRDQLDFFVKGFSNLRKRHDELIEDSSALSAEDEIMHDLYLTIATTESNFCQRMIKTFEHKIEIHRNTEKKLRMSENKIDELKQRIKNIEEDRIADTEKAKAFQKNVGCYRIQLRKSRNTVRKIREDTKDLGKIRSLLVAHRSHIFSQLYPLSETAMSLLSDRNTKDIDNTLDSMYKVLNTSFENDLIKDNDENAYPKVSIPKVNLQSCIESDIRFDAKCYTKGIVIVGTKFSGRKTQAAHLCERLNYISIDAGEFVVLGNSGVVNPEDDATDVMCNKIDIVALTNRIRMIDCVEQGYILHNWEFVKRELDELIMHGCSIDLIIYLDIDEGECSTRELNASSKNRDLPKDEVDLLSSILSKNNGKPEKKRDSTKSKKVENNNQGAKTSAKSKSPQKKKRRLKLILLKMIKKK